MCEFIEDCEFTYLSTQILHLLGAEGPKTQDPAKYIRYIYNRIILENATVRAAAVSSLAQFGADVEGLRPRVTTLIRRALHDNDDEVRDRATLYLKQLEGLAGGPESVRNHLHLPLRNLEATLKAYVSNPSDDPFDLVISHLLTHAFHADAFEPPGKCDARNHSCLPSCVIIVICHRRLQASVTMRRLVQPYGSGGKSCGLAEAVLILLCRQQFHVRLHSLFASLPRGRVERSLPWICQRWR